MKKLKRVLLINWHYFWNETIELDGINFLTGRNASGKSTLIDALQLLMLGDTSGHFFNKAANEKSKRTLKGYLRGELGDDGGTGYRYLRNGRFSSYIACEFHDTVKNSYFTLGVVFDCYSDSTEEHRFFVLDSAIPDNRFTHNSIPMSFTELRVYVNKNYKKGKFEFPDTNRRYQEIIKGKLGGLKNKYFGLFKKAVPFTPITDIETFITEYVCDVKAHVDISIMQDNIRYYKRLEHDAEMMEARVKALEEISQRYILWTEEKQKLEMQTYIIERAQHQTALDNLAALTDQKTKNEDEIIRLTSKQSRCIAEIAEMGKEKDRLTTDKMQSDIYRKMDELEKKKADLYNTIKQLNEALRKTINCMKRYGLVWRSSIQKLYEQNREESNQVIAVESKKSDYMLNSVLSTIEATIKETEQAWTETLKLADPALKYAEAFLDMNIDTISILGEDGFNKIKECINLLKEEAGRLKGAYQRAVRETGQKVDVLREEIAGLEKGIKPYNKKLLGLKQAIEDSLEKIHHKRVEVFILADLLEVKDARWSNAVEAYLHTQKFYLILEPQYFQDALRVYDKLKFEEGFYDIGLVDTGKLLEKKFNSQAGSLADEIITENQHARNFIDYVMGQVMKCDRVEELRNYKKAITDSCMLYQGFVARQLNPERWQTPYIGRKSIEAQIKIKKFAFEKLKQIKTIFTDRVSVLESTEKMESMNTNETDNVLSVLEKASCIPELEQELEEVTSNLSKIDLTWLNQLDDKIKALESQIIKLNETERKLNNEIVKIDTLNQTIQEEKIPNAQAEVKRRREHIDSRFDANWINEKGEPRFIREWESRSSAQEVYNNFFSQVSRTESQAAKKKEALSSCRAQYNSDYKMSWDIHASDNNAFDRELAEMSEIKLPQYRKQIEDAKEKAFEQFQDDFIAKLKSSIDTVKGQISELNDALKMSSFGNDKYRFVLNPKPEYRRYYDMITDEMLLEGYNLASHQFREKHREAIDELFRQIIDVDTELNADARAELEQNIKRFTNFKTYLSFDLIVTDPDDHSQRLSRTLNKKSGGETQTPFYISVLASFAQLYRIGQKNESGNTIRFIIFDEAFSKMDSERIQESIKLLRRFGLQAILSAPPEKIGDIAPLVDRNICIFREGDNAIAKAFDSKKLIEV
ncbi:MAG: ATP-binding protein [Acetivibrionales bacterium]|jgi:uncharacterized protein YPO0396